MLLSILLLGAIVLPPLSRALFRYWLAHGEWSISDGIAVFYREFDRYPTVAERDRLLALGRDSLPLTAARVRRAADWQPIPAPEGAD